MQKSPIKISQLRILTQRKAKQIAKEIGADKLIILARRGGSLELQEHNCNERDVLFAAQTLLAELDEFL